MMVDDPGSTLVTVPLYLVVVFSVTSRSTTSAADSEPAAIIVSTRVAARARLLLIGFLLSGAHDARSGWRHYGRHRDIRQSREQVMVREPLTLRRGNVSLR